VAWEQVEDINLKYSGSWTFNIGDSNYSLSSRNVSSSGLNGDSCSFSGYMRGIKIYGIKGNAYGIHDVYVDGAKVGSFDQYSATWVTNALLFSKLDLSPGWHTIQIKQSGKNTSSSNYTMSLDYLSVDFVPPVENGIPVKMFNRAVAFGDSITDGKACVFKKDRYGEILGRVLGVPIYVQGASGASISDVQTHIEPAIKPLNPDLVFWLGGANDSSAQITGGSLANAVDKMRNELPNAEIIFATFTDNTSATAAENQAKVDAMKQVAQEKGILFVDFYTLTKGNTSFLTDTIHPGTAGHRVLAQGFLDAVYQYYRGSKTKRLPY